MNIKIINAESHVDGWLITFLCRAGKGAGLWVSSLVPEVGFEYTVEVDIDKSIDELRYCNEAQNKQSIEFCSSVVLIRGMIESIEEDGMCYLRLSDDCLIMIDSGDIVFEEGGWIELKLAPIDIEITAQGF